MDYASEMVLADLHEDDQGSINNEEEVVQIDQHVVHVEPNLSIISHVVTTLFYSCICVIRTSTKWEELTSGSSIMISGSKGVVMRRGTVVWLIRRSPMLGILYYGLFSLTLNKGRQLVLSRLSYGGEPYSLTTSSSKPWIGTGLFHGEIRVYYSWSGPVKIRTSINYLFSTHWTIAKYNVFFMFNFNQMFRIYGPKILSPAAG